MKLNDMAQALVQGKIDAAASWDPHLTAQQKALEAAYRELSLADQEALRQEALLQQFLGMVSGRLAQLRDLRMHYTAAAPAEGADEAAAGGTVA